MKTKDQELADLEKKYADERVAIEAKYAVLACLPDLGKYAPPFVHHHHLYGAVGSLDFKVQRYSSIAEGASPDRDLLSLLLEKFPPEPAVKIKGTCTSLRPEPETYQSDGECTDIEPVHIDIDPSEYSHSVAVEWWAKIGGQLWDFKVEFPIHGSKVGRLYLRYKRYADSEVSSVETCQFYPSDHTAKVIRWASGSHKDPNRFTVYWERGRNPDILSMF